MAEIKNIGGQPPPVDRNVEKLSDDAARLPGRPLPPNSAADEAASVTRGNVGQPVGLPTAEPTTQNALMPGVVTGRDASQLIAADKLRAAGGHSATEVLLGLNRQPPTPGLLPAPPGNLEMLRHLSPAMRRKVLRNLLAKQRGQMRQLVAVMRDTGGQNHPQQDEEAQPRPQDDADGSEAPAAAVGEIPGSGPPATAVYDRRAVQDLEAATKMLDLLDELLGMQDYALSQMGTFAQG